jgi:2-dehydropantoate 2-reductase
MRILVFGAGSIGTYLGTRLYAAGHDVLLVGRGKLQTVGKTLLIDSTAFPVPSKSRRLPAKGKYNIIFITSKLYDLKKNLSILAKSNIQYDILASIQNGLVEPESYKVKGISNVTTISVFEGFRLTGSRLHTSPSPTGWRTEASASGRKVANVLREAGILCRADPNLQVRRAEKTIMNCSVNLLSAIEKKTFAQLCAQKQTRQRIDRLFDESYDVLRTSHNLPSRKSLRRKFYRIVEPMRHYSSTYQDIISGRRTEAEFLNGFILRHAKARKIGVPENERIWREFARQKKTI